MRRCTIIRRRTLLGAALGFALPSAEALRLSLPYRALPHNAPLLAGRAVSAVREIEGIELDFSHESLRHIDRAVLHFRERGARPEDVGETLFVLGCYVGEVVVRQLGARWVLPSAEERDAGFDWMGLRTRSGAFWDPINKVFKLLRNGEEDSVWYLFTVIRDE